MLKYARVATLAIIYSIKHVCHVLPIIVTIVTPPAITHNRYAHSVLTPIICHRLITHASHAKLTAKFVPMPQTANFVLLGSISTTLCVIPVWVIVLFAHLHSHVLNAAMVTILQIIKHYVCHVPLDVLSAIHPISVELAKMVIILIHFKYRNYHSLCLFASNVLPLA